MSVRPPLDPELAAVMAVASASFPPVRPDGILEWRQVVSGGGTDDTELAALGITRTDVAVAGYDGADLVASVLARADRVGIGPGVLHLHGGGMIMGDRLTAAEHFLPWILDNDAVVVSLDYRLAPEFPDPYPVEDCYAGLLWTAENAASLGIDPERLLLSGASSGGGLAAGTALLARDRGGPSLLGQVLLYPMLDDRDRTVSTLQHDGHGVWNRESNRTGWSALLGDRRGTDDVSIYAAPARATDLSGLPPAFVDCGSAEVFRDEAVAYASALWRSGVQAELHVWPGGFHGCDVLAPHTALAHAMASARNAWVRRALSPPS
ncbi:MAG TPA: alpha/beta hydrolase [Nocardioides sp.]|nr:alpha/beta hydrolase [Nocardioides sp.]